MTQVTLMFTAIQMLKFYERYPCLAICLNNIVCNAMWSLVTYVLPTDAAWFHY